MPPQQQQQQQNQNQQQGMYDNRLNTHVKTYTDHGNGHGVIRAGSSSHYSKVNERFFKYFNLFKLPLIMCGQHVWVPIKIADGCGLCCFMLRKTQILTIINS